MVTITYQKVTAISKKRVRSYETNKNTICQSHGDNSPARDVPFRDNTHEQLIGQRHIPRVTIPWVHPFSF